MPRCIEWIQAAQEKGWTMPVVPSTDSPPMMPSRGFQVFSASSAPFSMAILDLDVGRDAVLGAKVCRPPASSSGAGPG
jgi:hypothetical protein